MTSIILGGERPMSLNKFYSGGHWSQRKEEADRVHGLVREAIDPERVQLYKNPVHIYVLAYFDKSPLDADNIAAKLYIDGLKSWLIADDTPAHVRSVTTSSRIDKSFPRVEIHLEEVQS